MFIHLLPKYWALQKVYAILMVLWKLIKYSFRKIAVFKKVARVSGCWRETKKKIVQGRGTLLVVTRWCSWSINVKIYWRLSEATGETYEGWITWSFHRWKVLRMNYLILSLLCTDLLTHVNRFSKFLLEENLVFS